MVRPAPVAALLGVLLVLLTGAVARAQEPSPSPFSAPRLRAMPERGFDARVALAATAGPTTVATGWTTATATTSMPTVTRRASGAGLPRTGADPLRLALAGLTLLGLGLALRFRVAPADAPHPV